MGRRLLSMALAAASVLAALPWSADADATSLSGRKIALDPGHGGSDPGAVGFGLEEQAVNLDVALRARDLLQQEGASVVMTRTCDCTVSLADRVAIANNNAVHRYISVHSNACGGCGGKGTETYYHSSLASTSTSASLANVLQSEMVEHLQTVNRGVKQADFYVLRNTNMPAVLVELAFIDTQADNVKLASPTWRQEAARAILHAVQRHFGIAAHDPAPPPPPPQPGFAVTILAPANNQWAGGITTARGTSNQESNLNWMRFLVDGDAARAKWVTPAPHEWAWDTRGWSDGAHALRLEGENKDGARASHDITVNLDNTPPVTGAGLSGTAGNNGWWRSSVSVGLSASDAGSGVAATYVAVDSGGFQLGTSASVSGDGVHTVRFYSVDRVGNTEGARSVSVPIDTTPPTLALTSPHQGQAWVNNILVPGPRLPLTLVVGTKTLEAGASDATSGVERVEFLVDNALRGTDLTAPYSTSWPAGAESLGTHQLRSLAVDRAGNSASTPGLTVHTAPTSVPGVVATLNRYT